jgi:hypothetical protein
MSGIIRIEIDMNSIEDMMPGYGDGDDDNFVCPVATQDEDINAENKQAAENEYSYGPTTATWENKNARCGTCSYFNLQSSMLNCISEGLGLEEGIGYCDKLHFACSMEKVCNLWELGVPKTDGDLEDYPSDMGNQRDIL